MPLDRKIVHPSGSKRVQVFPGNWHLYELHPSEYASFLWVPFKVSNSALPRQWRRLRTFWLTWNPLDLRLAANKYSVRLETEQPELYARVNLYLELTYDRDWLLREHGATDEEIAAERARLAAGIVVRDATGAEVKVEYGATADQRTCYAYIAGGGGFIGGWQCLPKKVRPRFRDLVDAINAGRLYGNMNDLPGGRSRQRK